MTIPATAPDKIPVSVLTGYLGASRSEGTNFRGSAVIDRKEKCPRWTPTANMIAAMPRYRPYASGLDGGPANPLGPRTLYLYPTAATS